MIVVEEARDDGVLVGWRLGVGASRVLVFADQQRMPGIREGREFVHRLGGHIDYKTVYIPPSSSTTALETTEAPRADVCSHGKLLVEKCLPCAREATETTTSLDGAKPCE